MRSASTTKPYLIRAIHEWCSDQGYTPYLVISVRGKMQVPMEYVKNGEIVLNVSYNASRNLTLGNEYITFSARFNGISRDIVLPVGAVVFIFAKENGEGMGFEYDAEGESGPHALDATPTDAPASQPEKPEDPDPETPAPAPSGARGHLRVVK